MNINTVLFDLDGTLIDTNELIIASFMNTLDHFYPEHPFIREDIISWIGEPLIESFNRVDPERIDELVAHYREFNLAHHDELVVTYEGVFSTVEKLYQQGYKLGIVTSKKGKAIELGLALSDLAQFFQVIVTPDDVTYTKPHPEPVLTALNRLASTPEEAIMVGDSPGDIMTGKRANTRTAGTAWTIKGREILEELEPDIMLEHMPELLTYLGV